MELMNHSATELAAMIKSKAVSPVDVVDAALNTIEKRNPAVNAMVFVAPEESRATAREAEAAVMRGDPLGVLHGVPTALKDLFDFKPGWPTTFGGVPAFKDFRADFSCAWCSRMEAAGAIVVGKTNSQLLGAGGVTDNPLFGVTRNPFDLSRNAGGSSGGAASAVAEGLLPFGEATDLGGSSRIPAAWSGVIGFKPSFGWTSYVSRPNAFIGTSAYPLEGVIARSMDDIAVALGVLVGPQPRDPQNIGVLAKYVDAPEASLAGMRIAYSRRLDVFAVDDEVATVVEDAVRALEAAGAIVDEVTIGFAHDQAEIARAMGVMNTPSSYESFEYFKELGYDLVRDHRDELPDYIIAGAENAASLTIPELAAAMRVRTQIFDSLQSTFDDYDLIVTPTVGCVAVPNATEGYTQGPSKIGDVDVNPNYGWALTYPFNMTGHPAMSVPAGMSPGGMPVGLQIIGKKFHDAQVVTAGRALETVRPWAQSYENIVSRQVRV